MILLEGGESRIPSYQLTHFLPLVYFYTPWKHQKTFCFLMFSGGIERDQWHKNGLSRTYSLSANSSFVSFCCLLQGLQNVLIVFNVIMFWKYLKNQIKLNNTCKKGCFFFSESIKKLIRK